MNIEKTIENLKKNNFAVTYVETKAEVAPLVEKMLTAGSTIAVGGSMTLEETDVMTLVRGRQYFFLDRYATGISDEQRAEIFRQSLAADYYLCSSNAVTENGELYNVDGNSNRIAAIAYGPKKVILVVGINKIVPDLPAAVRRVKTIAAPKNAARLHCATYCATAGHCVRPDGMAGDGCNSEARICCNTLISAQQRHKGRIHVILVGEECGY